MGAAAAAAAGGAAGMNEDATSGWQPPRGSSVDKALQSHDLGSLAAAALARATAAAASDVVRDACATTTIDEFAGAASEVVLFRLAFRLAPVAGVLGC